MGYVPVVNTTPATNPSMHPPLPTPPPPHAALSPSLAPARISRVAADPGAFEIKFLLSEDLAAQVESRFSGLLAVDPHADPALGGAYAITSL